MTKVLATVLALSMSLGATTALAAGPKFSPMGCQDNRPALAGCQQIGKSHKKAPMPFKRGDRARQASSNFAPLSAQQLKQLPTAPKGQSYRLHQGNVVLIDETKSDLVAFVGLASLLFHIAQN